MQHRKTQGGRAKPRGSFNSTPSQTFCLRCLWLAFSCALLSSGFCCWAKIIPKVSWHTFLLQESLSNKSSIHLLGPFSGQDLLEIKFPILKHHAHQVSQPSCSTSFFVIHAAGHTSYCALLFLNPQAQGLNKFIKQTLHKVPTPPHCIARVLWGPLSPIVLWLWPLSWHVP